jgi:hypothetical protein
MFAREDREIERTRKSARRFFGCKLAESRFITGILSNPNFGSPANLNHGRL